MKIQANERKQLNTAVLNHLFTQGEAGVDVVCIQLPLQYGQADLTSLGWTVQLVGEKDSFVSKVLEKEIAEEALILRWLVDEDCTAAAGKVKVTVVGTSEDGKTVIKFDGNSIFVKEAAYGSFAPAPDTLAAALLQVQRASEEAVSAARSATIDALAAQEAASRSPYIGADGFWYVFDKEKGEYGKSEILAQGPAGPQGPAGESSGVQSVNGVLPDETGDVAIDLPSRTGIRPNLLDNWYFGNPVNQRGQTSYLINGYTIDRWKTQNASTEVSLTANGVKVVQTYTSQPRITQLIETVFPAGTTMTVSAIMKGDGINAPKIQVREVFSSDTIFIGDATNDEWQMVTATFVTELEGAPSVGLYCSTNNENPPVLEIVAAKLELGEGQTLAHQDGNGNWVLNEIPNYAEELAKCQRYQVIMSGMARYRTMLVQANSLDFYIPTPVTMRAVPAFSVPTARITSFTSSASFTDATWSVVNINPAGVYLRATKSDHGFTDARADLEGGAIFDANL